MRRTVSQPLAAALLLLAAASAAAQAPPGYYDSVDASNASSLRTTLHEVVDDHVRFPYTAATTDTWDILNLADEDPNNTANIIDVYKNASYTKIPGGTGAYNREHTWPKSYGFPNDNSDNYPYTDCHMLFLSDSGYNSSRSNKPYRTCHAGCSENPTDFNDGRGGGSGVYPGNSNWTEGSFTQGTWETWDGRKGDVARAVLYMDIRYEGGVHGSTGSPEPDLVLTDVESLIDASNTGSNESVAYMGMLSVLLQWHQQDPVDSREVWRNEVVYTYQGNRNPFIDHPEWVECLYDNVCTGDTTPPAAPTGLVATALNGGVDLAWDANSENDLDGYNVYRSTTAGGPYAQVNAGLVGVNAFTDTGLTNGTTYYYVVTAVDTSSNESADSDEASATPDAGLPDTTPPAAPTGLAAAAGDGRVDLTWAANGEGDLDGYNVYRSTTPGGPYGQINGALVGSPAYTDATVANGTTYHYVVTAVDTSGNESADSAEASATPQAPNATGVILSEVYYNAPSTDDGFEWVELHNADSNGIDLSGYCLGNGGTDYTYSTAQLSGTIAGGATFVVGGPNSDANNANPVYDLVLNFSPDFQNSGATADGVALFDVPCAQVGPATVPVDAVVYGGSNANGLIDETGAANAPEVGDSGVGSSIERIDLAGNWQVQGSPTPNAAAAAVVGGGDVTPPAPPGGLVATAGDGQVDLSWSASPEGDLAGYDVHRATASGGPYTRLNGSLLTSPSYADTGVTNGTTYYYVVTATDATGNQSDDSAEAQATPGTAGPAVSVATADWSTSRGTIAGSYLDTHVQDGVYEELIEGLSGGKPSNRYSTIDHVWTFDVAAGQSYTFYVDAHHTANGEGDDFELLYSLNDVDYTHMLTVTKTADDSVLQSYVFPEDVAGTLYVLARDLDATPGAQTLDTLFVDEMYVETTGGGGGDTTPPAAPTGLAATPGDGSVSLDWADNGEPDLDGYHVHRGTASGGPYTQLTGSPVAASDYLDGTAVNGTTYYYVVTAVDTSGNESADSNEASATPQGGGGGTAMHVASIVPGTQNAGQGFKHAIATVTVVDDGGNPVDAATVTGTFSGDYSETQVGVTAADGTVTLVTAATRKGGVSFTLCVDDVAHATLTYDPGANVESCDSL